MKDCAHQQVTLLNPYELIRKYRCEDCGGIMMCSCDEEFGRRFLPHQLDCGCELETQRRLPVNLVFQKTICRECRGLPLMAYPKAALFGRTTKIQRYYWREIFFETTRRIQVMIDADGGEGLAINEVDRGERWKRVEKDVIEHIKTLHSSSPKYVLDEEPQSHVLWESSVATIDLHATFVKSNEKKVRLLYGGRACTAEEYATSFLEEHGYSVLFTESVPFHTLFGVMLYPLIQDAADPRVKHHGFGNRETFARGERGGMIWTLLPEDFGTPTYAERRHQEVGIYFDLLPSEKADLLAFFDAGLEGSWPLRQYLWAYHPENIVAARKIVEILEVDVVYRVLRFLLGDYWRRYLGWPDLLAYRDCDYLFVEVKASRDKLSGDQLAWIKSNRDHLRLPFKIIKIHRQRTVEEGGLAE